MAAESYTLRMDEEGVSISLRVSKVAGDGGWIWAATVGGDVSSSSGQLFGSAAEAEAVGEAWCREIAREQLMPHRKKMRLELDLMRAELAHDLTLLAAAGIDVPESARPTDLGADARVIERVAETRRRIDDLKAELDRLKP